MNRAQKEKLMRSVRRTCMGPREQDLGEVVSRLKGHRLEDDLIDALKDLDAETTDEAIGDLTRIRMDLASVLKAAAHEGCGEDINELILSHPLDGKPKEAECPGCGRTVRWRPEKLDAD